MYAPMKFFFKKSRQRILLAQHQTDQGVQKKWVKYNSSVPLSIYALSVVKI